MNRKAGIVALIAVVIGLGGGAAALLLDPEEEDILEAGIEMTARPPGKQTNSISLLSGGEKALTTLALLFAIFQRKQVSI